MDWLSTATSAFGLSGEGHTATPATTGPITSSLDGLQMGARKGGIDIDTEGALILGGAILAGILIYGIIQK